MPRETTPEEIAQAYLDGWKLGLKALAIYRDGSKESQPLNTGTEADRLKAKETAKPRRDRLPDTRNSLTHKFSISGHEGYITVGLFEDGRPGELFITMAKEGSTIGGLMDAFGTSVSMSLQYGVPLEDYVRKFSHMRFEPQGYTKNPDIRIAKSIIDYIFRWLGNMFLPGYKEATSGVPPKEDAGGHPEGTRQGAGDTQLSEPKPVDKKSGGRGGAKEQDAGGRGQGSGKETPRATATSSSTNVTAVSDSANPDPKSAISNQQSEIHNGNGHANGYSAKLLERAGVLVKTGDASGSEQNELFASFQSDAPVCDGCGSITVRSGNCYLCYNCGTSMGCS
jgi:ribonucleoside-diphosphate reductase alpha chain